MRPLLATVVALSCSSSTSSIALEQVPAELSKAYCEKIYACCSADERMRNFLLGTDQASCEASLSTLVAASIPGLQVSIAKGRSAYHAEKMGSCILEVRGARCADLRANPMGVGLTSVPECAAAFEAKVAVGGACNQNDECVGGFCEDATARCAALKTDGQPCSEGEECTGKACSNQTCGAPTPGTAGICS